MQATGDGVSLRVIKEANDPKRIDEQMRALKALSDTGAWKDAAFNVEFGRTHPRKADLSRLRSAYLVAFALFGYRYAFSRRLRLVREQLENVEQTILPVFSITDVDQPRSEHRVFRVNEPEWLRSLAVQLGRHIIFLPDLWTNSAPYDAMAQQANVGQPVKITMRGDFFRWPMGPMHTLDGTLTQET